MPKLSLQVGTWATTPPFLISYPQRSLIRRLPYFKHTCRTAFTASIKSETWPSSPDVAVPRIPHANPALSFSPSSQFSSEPGSISNFTEPVAELPQSIRTLLHAIGNRNPEGIWRCYLNVRGKDFLALTAGHFSAVLLSIRPQYYIPIHTRAYFDLWYPTYDPADETDLLAKVMSGAAVKQRMLERIKYLLKDSKQRGIQLGLREYTHLLDCARGAGDADMARALWHEMGLRGVTRDTKCYNTYLAAMCGTTLTEAEWKTDPRTIAKRKERPISDVGAFAIKMLEKMLAEGLRPDNATFDFVLLAQSKIGHLGHMRALIQHCWGVDIAVERLEQNADSVSPLNLIPTPQTLSNIAIALSQVKQPAAAIRLVDYLSRTYSIDIPFQTWMQLLVWAYTLSRPPAATRTLPESSVTEVWRIMQDDPYNIKPDIEMYDYIIRHHLAGQRFVKAERLIDEAIEGPFRTLEEKARQSFAALNDELGVGSLPGVPEPKKSQSYFIGKWNQTPISSKAAEADALLFRARSLARRWVELLIYGQCWSEQGSGIARTFPPLKLSKYGQSFLGSSISYPTGTGFVMLQTGLQRCASPIRRTQTRGPWRWRAKGTPYGQRMKLDKVDDPGVESDAKEIWEKRIKKKK